MLTVEKCQVSSEDESGQDAHGGGVPRPGNAQLTGFPALRGSASQNHRFLWVKDSRGVGQLPEPIAYLADQWSEALRVPSGAVATAKCRVPSGRSFPGAVLGLLSARASRRAPGSNPPGTR